MENAAITYRNTQVALSLVEPEATAYWTDCPAYGRYRTTEITAALRHGRDSDEAQPKSLNGYLIGTWLQANGWDTSWIH